MKWLVVIPNVALIVVMGYLVYSDGGPQDGIEWLVIGMFLLAPASSLWYVSMRATTTEASNFLALYIKRRTLEEQCRIKALSNDSDSDRK